MDQVSSRIELELGWEAVVFTQEMIYVSTMFVNRCARVFEKGICCKGKLPRSSYDDDDDDVLSIIIL